MTVIGRLGVADLRHAESAKHTCALTTLDQTPKNASVYGVNILTTVCTALLVPFTVLCATFLAVIAVSFATCRAVRTGPASTLPAQTANARMTENNAFMVLKFRNRGVGCAYAILVNSRMKTGKALPHSERMAPAVGFEPTTNRLTADRSTTELRWIVARCGGHSCVTNH